MQVQREHTSAKKIYIQGLYTGFKKVQANFRQIFLTPEG